MIRMTAPRARRPSAPWSTAASPERTTHRSPFASHARTRRAARSIGSASPCAPATSWSWARDADARRERDQSRENEARPCATRAWRLGWSCSRTVPPKVRPGVSLRTTFPGRTAIERRSSIGPAANRPCPPGGVPTGVRLFPARTHPKNRAKMSAGPRPRDASDRTIAGHVSRFASGGQERELHFPLVIMLLRRELARRLPRSLAIAEGDDGEFSLFFARKRGDLAHTEKACTVEWFNREMSTRKPPMSRRRSRSFRGTVRMSRGPEPALLADPGPGATRLRGGRDCLLRRRPARCREPGPGKRSR